MSWQLAAFAILTLGLVLGFIWYERTKPDAKLVALVGTLAALGAVGRIAFAAIPNVKPTTDIVLIAGFALGGAPGFVVGATAALTSNFFFGQGPWTPWQMAGWGATGVIGALLARVTNGRVGRRRLAAVCFVVGFAFTALQDCGDWVTYSDHSLAQLGIYVGKGVGFDLIHALGCVAFALLFGQSLIRALRRFRERMDVRWQAVDGHALLPVLLIAIVLPAAVMLGHPPASAAAVTRRSPLLYLRGAENRDGGWGAAARQPSSSLFSGWATMALAAAGGHPANAARYLASHPGGHDAGDLERTILAGVAAGDAPTRAPIRGWLRSLLRDVKANGSVSNQTNLTAFAILAERACGHTPAARSVAWLVAQADRDGGFNWSTRGGDSDVDDTGAVLEALAGTGQTATIKRAVRFIRAQQNRDGGFGGAPGAASDAQSTAFAVQGLVASGVNPATVHHDGGPSPDAYLRALIQPDGAVDYARGNGQTPVWVTAQAELALAGRALPLRLKPAPRTHARAG